MPPVSIVTGLIPQCCAYNSYPCASCVIVGGLHGCGATAVGFSTAECPRLPSDQHWAKGTCLCCCESPPEAALAPPSAAAVQEMDAAWKFCAVFCLLLTLHAARAEEVRFQNVDRKVMQRSSEECKGPLIEQDKQGSNVVFHAADHAQHTHSQDHGYNKAKEHRWQAFE